MAWAVGEYTAEWVSLALDRVEERNHEPGKKAVRSWGFVLGILQNRRQKGWTPPEAKPTPRPPAPVKASAEPSFRPPLLTAEQVAQCRQPGREARWARSGLRRAILDGQVPAELLSTIPAELLAGPEVPAPRSGS